VNVLLQFSFQCYFSAEFSTNTAMSHNWHAVQQWVNVGIQTGGGFSWAFSTLRNI